MCLRKIGGRGKGRGNGKRLLFIGMMMKSTLRKAHEKKGYRDIMLKNINKLYFSFCFHPRDHFHEKILMRLFITIIFIIT